MQWLLFLWLALTFSLVQTQEHLSIYRRYQSMRVLQNAHVEFTTPLTQALTTTHHCRIQQLTMTRRHLEALTTRLSLEVQELLARRHHADEQLREPWYQGRCECESSDALNTPTPTPAQPAEYPEAGNGFAGNSSWQLEPTEPKSADSGSTGDGAASSRHGGSFLTSTMFVLAVLFMAIPVACVIGFVLFCKRRRRPQHTHV